MVLATDVVAAELHTIEAMKLMFTMANSLNEDSVSWVKCHRLPEILHNAGYYTGWYSNQGDKGVYDNVATRIAQICDTMKFTQHNSTSLAHRPYDERLLNIIDISNLDSVPRTYFIHLAGSHTAFSQRYPVEYEKFNANDYPELTPYQAGVMAQYDNSILYNDYVVFEIIKKFSKTDALVLYLADHGLDLFETDPNKAIHGFAHVPSSVDVSKRVPFIIYTSPLFRQLHYEMQERIETIANQHLDLTYLPEIVCNLLGIKVK